MKQINLSHFLFRLHSARFDCQFPSPPFFMSVQQCSQAHIAFLFRMTESDSSDYVACSVSFQIQNLQFNYSNIHIQFRF